MFVGNTSGDLGSQDKWSLVTLVTCDLALSCRKRLSTPVAEMCSTSTKLKLVWQCYQTLNKLGKGNKITLLWIPQSHSRLKSNITVSEYPEPMK